MKSPTRIGSAEYDIAVEREQKKIRGNVTSAKLSPQECAKEVAQIEDGAVSGFAESDVQDRTVMEVQPIPPKRRGRPPGSRNKPKSQR